MAETALLVHLAGLRDLVEELGRKYCTTEEIVWSFSRRSENEMKRRTVLSVGFNRPNVGASTREAERVGECRDLGEGLQVDRRSAQGPWGGDAPMGPIFQPLAIS